MNTHSQHLQTLTRAVSDVDKHASFVEDKLACMKKEAGKTIKGIATRITAIEEACTQMVTVLTQRLTAQCQTFQETLNGFSEGLNTAYKRLDEFRLAEQEWTHNSHTLKAVEKRQTQLIAEVEKLAS